MVTACACGVAWWVARWSQADKVRKAGGWVLVGLGIVLYRNRFLDGFEPSWELPFQVCDVLFFVCVLTVFKPTRLGQELVFFWGLAGTLQAVVTPDVLRGYPSPEYLAFFLGHGVLLAAVTFLLSNCRFRPTPLGILRAQGCLLAYTGVVGFINFWGGWNYGYLCRKPEQPTLLDFLGPWPFYLLTSHLVAFFLFCLLYSPWAFTENPDSPTTPSQQE